MATVAELIDRIFRDYLEPPNDQPALLKIETAFTNAADQTFVYAAGFTDPSDLDQLGQGALLDVGSTREMVRVTGFVIGTRTVTVTRGAIGTTAASTQAAVDDMVKIAPDITRQSVWEAVGDNIVGLYSELWQEKQVVFHSGSNRLAPSDAIGVVEWVDPTGTPWPVRFQRKATGGGAGKVLFDGIPLGVGTLIYKARFVQPTDETTVLSSLGVLEHWERVVMAGAVADVLAGGDISRRVQEYVTETLQAQGIPFGSGERIRNSIARWAATLKDQAARDLLAETGVVVESPVAIWI